MDVTTLEDMHRRIRRHEVALVASIRSAGGDWQLRDSEGRWIEMGSWVKWMDRGKIVRGKVTDYKGNDVRVDLGRGRTTVVDRTSITALDPTEIRQAPESRFFEQRRSPAARQQARHEARARMPLGGESGGSGSTSGIPNRPGMGDRPVLYGGLVSALQAMLAHPDDDDSVGHSLFTHLLGVEEVTLPDGTTTRLPVFTPDRRALHDKIIESFLSKYTGPDAPEDRTYVFLGGGPASGKSTALQSGILSGVPDYENGEAVEINADEIKTLIPEGRAALDLFYAQDRSWASDSARAQWAASVHVESSYLSARLSAAIEERRLPAVFDGVGDGGWQGWAETAATQQDNGYTVRARYMTTPVETAMDRSRSRADETGRGVPEHIIRHGHEGVSNDLPMLLGMSREDGSLLLPDVALAYNDNAGSSEILRTDPSTGAVTIVDMEAWLAFIQKGSKNRQRRSIAATNAIVAFGKPGGDLRMFRRIMDRIREHDMEISKMVSSESGGVGGESWTGAGSAASKVVDWLQTPPGTAVPAEIVSLLV